MNEPLIRRRRRTTSFHPRQLLWFFRRATKREKLIFTTLCTTTAVLITAFSPFPVWLLLFAATIATVVGLVLYALWEDFGGIRYVVIPMLPVLYTIAALLMFVAIPMHPVIRFLLVAMFGLGMYLVMLISNIFNIAAIKTIPLMRAAHAASFTLNLVVVFLFSFFVSTLKLNPFIQMVVIFGLTVWPIFYMLWSFRLKPELSAEQLYYPIVLSGIIAETSFVLGFWPVSPLMAALFLTTELYVCAGVLQQDVVKRLRFKIIAEYFAVLLFVLCLLLITAQWGG